MSILLLLNTDFVHRALSGDIKLWLMIFVNEEVEWYNYPRAGLAICAHLERAFPWALDASIEAVKIGTEFDCLTCGGGKPDCGAKDRMKALEEKYGKPHVIAPLPPGAFAPTGNRLMDTLHTLLYLSERAQGKDNYRCRGRINRDLKRRVSEPIPAPPESSVLCKQISRGLLRYCCAGRLVSTRTLSVSTMPGKHGKSESITAQSQKHNVTNGHIKDTASHIACPNTGLRRSPTKQPNQGGAIRSLAMEDDVMKHQLIIHFFTGFRTRTDRLSVKRRHIH